MFWIIVALLIIGASALMIATIVGCFSKHQKCYWQTRHHNSEPIGSIVSRTGPRFLYHCNDCGLYWSEPWSN